MDMVTYKHMEKYIDIMVMLYRHIVTYEDMIHTIVAITL